MVIVATAFLGKDRPSHAAVIRNLPQTAEASTPLCSSSLPSQSALTRLAPLELKHNFALGQSPHRSAVRGTLASRVAVD